jgi:hypothetical protein
VDIFIYILPVGYFCVTLDYRKDNIFQYKYTNDAKELTPSGLHSNLVQTKPQKIFVCTKV